MAPHDTVGFSSRLIRAKNFHLNGGLVELFSSLPDLDE